MTFCIVQQWRLCTSLTLPWYYWNKMKWREWIGKRIHGTRYILPSKNGMQHYLQVYYSLRSYLRRYETRLKWKDDAPNSKESSPAQHSKSCESCDVTGPLCCKLPVATIEHNLERKNDWIKWETFVNYQDSEVLSK